MKNDNINISSIETHLDKVIREHVIKDLNAICYASTLPSTLSPDIDSYVVIDCANSVNDFNAYARGIVNIYLYAQPIANGAKNVAALSKLESAFNKALMSDKFDKSGCYSVARELVYSNSDYDSTYNMHFIIKAIRLIII